MANVSTSQLETYSSDLSSSIQTIIRYLGDAPHLVIANDAPSSIRRARNDILRIAGRLQTLMAEPTDLVRELSHTLLLV
jgi:hypothetical protein